ncbi:hypothetical protein J6590_014697 [Homalodisca vitripennis]|nr:hypothetical protein J6590_014697 [Homalodisca vitripennis]
MSNLNVLHLKTVDAIIKGRWVCETCGRAYLHQPSLCRHRKFQCGIAPQFRCFFCPHVTKLKTHLVKHIKVKHAT